jgi:hypothetical protein
MLAPVSIREDLGGKTAAFGDLRYLTRWEQGSKYMRVLGLTLVLLGVGFGLAGLFFGRASWVGMNNHSMPTWLLWEILAVILVMLGFGIRFFRAAH